MKGRSKRRLRGSPVLYLLPSARGSSPIDLLESGLGCALLDIDLTGPPRSRHECHHYPGSFSQGSHLRLDLHVEVIRRWEHAKRNRRTSGKCRLCKLLEAFAATRVAALQPHVVEAIHDAEKQHSNVVMMQVRNKVRLRRSKGLCRRRVCPAVVRVLGLSAANHDVAAAFHYLEGTCTHAKR